MISQYWNDKIVSSFFQSFKDTNFPQTIFICKLKNTSNKYYRGDGGNSFLSTHPATDHYERKENVEINLNNQGQAREADQNVPNRDLGNYRSIRCCTGNFGNFSLMDYSTKFFKREYF